MYWFYFNVSQEWVEETLMRNTATCSSTPWVYNSRHEDVWENVVKLRAFCNRVKLLLCLKFTSWRRGQAPRILQPHKCVPLFAICHEHARNVSIQLYAILSHPVFKIRHENVWTDEVQLHAFYSQVQQPLWLGLTWRCMGRRGSLHAFFSQINLSPRFNKIHARETYRWMQHCSMHSYPENFEDEMSSSHAGTLYPKCCGVASMDLRTTRQL